MAPESLLAKHRTARQIRQEGAVGNLQEGILLDLQGVRTRLVAWPGNGFQTEAVHVLTLPPGRESSSYAYDLSEEAMLCLAGRGEVFLHGAWRSLQPGDVAYFPEGLPHALRNAGTTDLVVVSQIAPAQLDLYEAAGFYNRGQGTMNWDAIFKATLNAPRGELPPSEMEYRDSEPEVRAEKLGRARVRAEGALFNVFLGNDFRALGLPGRLILWPPSGPRMVGFNYVFAPAGETDVIHAHPISDECLVVWEGTCQGYLAAGYSGGRWTDLETYDVLLAPCGVLHGHRSGARPCVMGGFASPPQPDLHFDSGYWKDGVYRQGDFVRLAPGSVPGIEELRS